MPFRLDVESLFHVPGRGTVLVGVVKDGAARVGDPVWVVSPGGRVRGHVAGVEIDRRILAEAPAGSTAALLVGDMDLDPIADGVVRDGLAVRPSSLRVESQDGGDAPAGRFALALHAVSVVAHGLRALLR